jgi:hypothetical protein
MFQEERDSTRFDWSDLGDIAGGRPHLGTEVSVLLYRLMQFSLRDAAIQMHGVTQADEMFRTAGRTAGRAVFDHLLDRPEDVNALVAKVQETFRDLKIGIMRVEHADPDAGSYTLTVAEDLDCSGLPPMGETICAYDEGLIAGLLESCTGLRFEVHEVDCWASGDRVCRFEAKASGPVA